MKILNISNMPIWLWGKGKGIPSIFFPQKGFAERGYEVHFLCPVKGEKPGYSFFEGIHIHRFDFPFNFRRRVYFQTDSFYRKLRVTLLSNLNWLFFQIVGFFLVIKFSAKLKPDIIYAHSPASAFPAYLASILFRTRLIIRLYGVRDLYWKWSNFFLRLKECRDYFVFKVPADYFIITNDGSWGNLLALKLGVKDERIKYWRNGIDSDLYTPITDARKAICRDLKIDPSCKIIVSTSRLISEYGAETLLCALIELFKVNHDSVCLIAGSGPEEKRLRELVQKCGISSRVLFLGIVDRLMIKKILYAADVFVFLPRDYNCTNTLWEAMACGRCIVTVENKAIKEVLTSGKDAILISSDKIKDVPGVLDQLLGNDDLRNELGRNARIRAEQALESWPDRVAREAEMLEKLLRNKER